MDFTFSEEQDAIRDLAARILSDRLPADRLRDLDGTDAWFADDVWAELAKAELLGVALPESDGGGGFGIAEACIIAEQIGRTVAPLPYLSAVVGAAMPLAEFGTPEQRARHLPVVIDGSRLLAVALYEPTDAALPALPATQATRAGDGWRLDGAKSFAVAADRAAAILVPARTSETASAVFLVDPTADGVTLDRERTVTGEPQFTIHLSDVAAGPDTVLGRDDQGADVVAWITARLMAAICATQTGVCEEALAITSRYVREREQFGAKLGTFQAVGHRIADAYIDTEGIRLTTLQAVWRLAAGVDATEELLVAKYWAAEGAQRVVHAAQHLHGGIGMDLDYPIHRYFRWAKVLELTLGGTSPSLRALGASLAARPAGAT